MTNQPQLPPRGMHPLERRVLAIGTAVVLHAVCLGGGAVMEALTRWLSQPRVLPHEPLLLFTAGLVLAHCSLGAIWWAQSKLPSYAKTLIAVLASAALWLLLVGLLEAAKMTESAGAAWAACIAVQTAIAGLGAAVLELATSTHERGSRFTIMFLLLWTAVIGVLLGAGRRAFIALGWDVANVLAWQWFYQLLTLGVCNAALAVGLLAAIRLPRNWTPRLLAAWGVAITAGIGVPCAFLILFGGNSGASFADIFWLIMAESLYIASVLIPLDAARMPGPQPPA